MKHGNSQFCPEYARIAELTAAMLAAARRSEWGELIALEAECKQAFSRIVDSADSSSVTPETAREKAALIKRVLADDAEIRKLVEPWMEELGRWLGSAGRSHRLQNVYSSGC